MVDPFSRQYRHALNAHVFFYRTVAHIHIADQGDYYAVTDELEKRRQGL